VPEASEAEEYRERRRMSVSERVRGRRAFVAEER
jgi:hypothetical protein